MVGNGTESKYPQYDWTPLGMYASGIHKWTKNKNNLPCRFENFKLNFHPL